MKDRPLDQWRSELLASNLTDRTKLVAMVASQFADWDTGENCYPSAPTIARLLRKSTRTVERALVELEQHGWFTRTHKPRPFNTTDYRLTVGTDRNASTDTRDGTSTDTRVGTKSTGFQSVPTPVTASTDTRVGTSTDTCVGEPPHTSSDRRDEEEEEESATAPPPDGGALRAPTVGEGSTVGYLDAVKAIEKQLRQQWPDTIGVKIAGENRNLLRQLIAAGWTLPQLLTLVADIGKPRSHPTGLIRKHLTQALDYDRADYEPVVHDDDDQEQNEPTPLSLVVVDQCDHGISRHLPKGSCQACTDFQQRMDDAVRFAERNGFTVNRGRRDEYGYIDIRLIAGNTYIEWCLDKHNEPSDNEVWVYIKNPDETQYGRLGQCHGGPPTVAEDGWNCAKIRDDLPVPERITGAVDIFALDDRREVNATEAS